MEIKDPKEVDKWVRGATLKEIKDVLIITLGRIKTKKELYSFLENYVETLRRRNIL